MTRDRVSTSLPTRISFACMEVNWDRVLPVGVGVALIEGAILGYVLTALSGTGFVLDYWALMAVIVGITTLIGAIAVERIASHRLPGADAAHLALIVGPLIGLAVGFLFQPRGGPV